MRILVVTECFWPDIYSVNDIVEKMVLRGHQVTVLTGLPDYTTSEIPPEYRHGQNRCQKYKGADVYRVATIPRKHGPVWRSLSYLSFWFNGVYAARHRKWQEFDAIYVWEVSPVTMAFPAIALKKRFHKPLFLYCMDIWPECVKAMGFKEKTLPYSLITAISRRAYHGCDHIAVSSRPFLEYLQRVDGVDRSCMSYLPQYGPAQMLGQNYDRESEHSNDQNAGVEFLFIGNIGKAQELDILIRAVSRMRVQQRYHFHIVGGGSEYEHCRSLAKELGITGDPGANGDRVVMTFYGPVPFEESLAMYRMADACVFTLNGDTHIGDTLPGKIQTYMAAGKPVLAACNGAGQEVIQESRCGVCVNAGDIDGYTRILTDFIEHPEKYQNCGSNARRYFMQNFMEEEYFCRLEKQLHTMIRGKQRDN